MAFVSVTTTSFKGQRDLSAYKNELRTSASAAAGTAMKFGLEKMLEKYARMAFDGPAGSKVRPNEPSKPSAVWRTFAASLLEKQIPTRSVMYLPENSYEKMMTFLVGAGRIFFAPGGPPSPTGADRYIAECATKQYKFSAVTSGVYSVACTEGTTKGQAEDSRTLALGKAFRMRQRPIVDQYGSVFETRTRAIAQANMCNYEESLSSRFPTAAAACVRGYAEANTLCFRSTVGTTKAEEYMAECIDRQYKYASVSGGVYEVACQDGASKGLPEYKRVSSLSAKFRAGQRSKLEKENAKFEAARYARANYSHLCSYEEGLFNKFPAVAAAMRPTTSRY